MRHTWLAVATLTAVGACGGKTESGGEGGLGSGGNGAQAGSGGSSVGGSSYGGSSYGGTGAYGGSGGSGTGGAGAFGGGGTGAGGSSSLDEKIAKICGMISALPCAMFDCENQLHQSAADAQAAGCFPEMDLVFDCALAYPLACEGPVDEGPTLAPQCDPVRDDLTQCMQGNGECSTFGGGNGCGMSCSGPGAWGVKCTSTPAGLDCLCTDGPNAGLSSTVPLGCNSATWQETVANLCS